MRTPILLAALLLATPLLASMDAPASANQAGAQDSAKSPASIPDNADSSDPAIKAIRAFIKSKSISKKNPQWKTQLPKPPKLTFNKDMQYFWNLETNKGNMIIELLADVAPMHVSSTIYLTELGFYDNIKFHRVLKGFMAQGGDPTGTGRGGPGYKYDGEFNIKVKHDRPGTLSMANTGRPTTDGSQFFLTFVPTPHLNMKHTVFGRVVKGMDTVRALERFGSGGQGTPTELLKIKRATFSVRPKAKAEAAGK